MARLHEVVDGIGFNRFHVMLFIQVGAINFAEGAGVLVLSAMLPSMAEDLAISQTGRAMLFSIAFAGVTVGGLLSGPVGDHIGRRPTLLWAHILICVFGTFCRWANTFYCMASLRFGLGIGLGLGIPASITLLVESTPTRYRDPLTGLLTLMFSLGEIFGALGCIIFMPTLTEVGQWTTLCTWATMPSYLMLPVSYMLLEESPRYLAVKCKTEQLRNVLEAMVRWSRSPLGCDVDIDVGSPGSTRSSGPKDVSDIICSLFRHDVRSVTLVCTFLCAVANFVFFGQSYAMAQIFPTLGRTSSTDISPAGHLLTSALFEVPGNLFCFVLVHYAPWGLKTSLQFLLGAITVLSVCLLSVDYGMYGVFFSAAYMIKFAAIAYYAMVYVYIATAFPTKCRGTGVGFCVSAGRLAALVAPLAFGESYLIGGTEAGFLLVTGVMALLAAAMASKAPVDMCGAPLVDAEEPLLAEA
mmetsp:Transcript_56825/g.151684  ORF Transcript_56825/g.151684 Transcript_56825/m.151684 type:complete len:468 (+) Transcript_56825:35-1438(+)